MGGGRQGGGRAPSLGLKPSRNTWDHNLGRPRWSPEGVIALQVTADGQPLSLLCPHPLPGTLGWLHPQEGLNVVPP